MAAETEMLARRGPAPHFLPSEISWPAPDCDAHSEAARLLWERHNLSGAGKRWDRGWVPTTQISKFRLEGEREVSWTMRGGRSYRGKGLEYLQRTQAEPWRKWKRKWERCQSSTNEQRAFLPGPHFNRSRAVEVTAPTRQGLPGAGQMLAAWRRGERGGRKGHMPTAS